MVIKFLNTIIANVAMSCTLRPKYETCFAKFHSIYLVFVNIEIIDTLRLSLDIEVFRVDLVMFIGLLIDKKDNIMVYLCWDNTWVSSGCNQH